MKTACQLGLPVLAVALALGGSYLSAQQSPVPVPAGAHDVAANPWAFSITADGYIVSNGDSYASPVFTADHKWLHLEARYNYENQRTGSLWAGYNFSLGKTVQLDITPMLGGGFGRTTGIAPACEVSLTYKRIQFAASNEYVFDTTDSSGSFFYSWPQLTYSPVDWLHVGLVAQHTKAFHTTLETQRGFLVGFSHKQMEFTTYVFDLGWADPTTVLEVGVSF